MVVGLILPRKGVKKKSNKVNWQFSLQQTIKKVYVFSRCNMCNKTFHFSYPKCCYFKMGRPLAPSAEEGRLNA